jgi:transposase-like protein
VEGLRGVIDVALRPVSTPMFTPTRCPWTSCPAHRNPWPGFFRRKGYYDAACRAHRIPRFHCKACGRSFSRQTFRADYYDKRPDLNTTVMQWFCSGVGQRQTAHMLRITHNNLVAKFRKIARHCGRLNSNLAPDFAARGRSPEFALDEAESFEACRVERPVTIPILIDQQTMFVVDTAVGTLPPRRRARRARAKQRARADERARLRSSPLRAKATGTPCPPTEADGRQAASQDPGHRQNESRAACAKVLATAARHCGPDARVRLRTDKKTTYPRLIAAAFGARLVSHLRIPGNSQRGPSSPLHRINLMLAKERDLAGRLRRRSWLVSKCREQLALHLDLQTCYHNFHRRRFSYDKEAHTPAVLLGCLPRPLSFGQMLSWRQDWGAERSVHPLSMGEGTVAEWSRTMLTREIPQEVLDALK